MFYCIGENSFTMAAVGSGSSVEEAIKNWARKSAGYNLDTEECYKTFKEYNPHVISGELINVEIKEVAKYELVIKQ